jgi:N-methylhydantoinase A
VKTDIRRRAKLTPGDVIVGPAVIHQVDTTVVVPPGCRSEVLADGSLLLHVARSATAGMVGAVATAGAAS